MAIVCSGDTPEIVKNCEENRSVFRDLYRKAFKNDYQAQRNTAYMLRDGWNPVLKNRTASCAWRLVILTMASPKVDSTDQANMRIECGSLDETTRAQAVQDARVIGRRILSGGKIDTSVPKRNPKLDSTANPL